jgi:hypothetical protein
VLTENVLFLQGVGEKVSRYEVHILYTHVIFKTRCYVCITVQSRISATKINQIKRKYYDSAAIMKHFFPNAKLCHLSTQGREPYQPCQLSVLFVSACLKLHNGSTDAAYCLTLNKPRRAASANNKGQHMSDVRIIHSILLYANLYMAGESLFPGEGTR